MSELECFTPGCRRNQPTCRHLKWLATGAGAYVQQCSPDCDLQLVRPGKVQCSCEDNE